MREDVFQRTHDGFAGFGRLPREFENGWRELLADFHGAFHCVQVFQIQDPPGRDGELHHRHQRVDLRGTDNQILIQHFAVEKGFVIPATNQVRAGKGIASYTFSEHVRYELLHLAPRMTFVVQPLRQRLAGHFPAGAVFVQREAQTELRIQFALAIWRRGFFAQRIRRIKIHVASIQLETVYAEILHEAVQLSVEPFHRRWIAKIQQRGITVPPLNHGGIGGGGPSRLGGRLLHQKTFVLQKLFHQSGLIRADKGADPKHHLEPHAMQFVHHLLRIREPARMEVPHAVVFLPRVVNHQHTGRKAIIEDAAGVSKNIGLILVVGQLDPSVVLRPGK